jgi:long-subunit acyl-CoA synthetase (AMP-forming)
MIKYRFYGGDLLKIKDDILFIKPTILFGVPRIYNRIVEATQKAF